MLGGTGREELRSLGAELTQVKELGHSMVAGEAGQDSSVEFPHRWSLDTTQGDEADI